ncbi:MAG: formimidoylglutamate deiminase [Actinomycetes bacterium]
MSTAGGDVTRYRCDYAWLPTGVAADVTIEATAGRITAVTLAEDESSSPRPNPSASDVQLGGLVLPGFANAHSHAFHRALRGRTHADGGTFWTWRQAMYAVAQRLTPDNYRALARAVFAEMALAGVTTVGEFHYLHHQPDGTPYDDPNEMGEVLRQAAREAGIRLTLLDTCYLQGGLDPSAAGGYLPLSPEQRRFGDGRVEGWAERFSQLREDETTRVGAAIHSVRAVAAADLPTIVAAASGRPLHVHLSEQPAENDACLDVHGVTPTRLLAEAGALGPSTTAVHATHLTADDIAVLGASHAYACFCPTTERDLADGIGPARALADAGARLCLGSDQHAVIDLLEEARALELHERLSSLQRGRLSLAELLVALTSAGHRSLGWEDTGSLEVGARADLVTVRLDTVRTSGALPEQAVMAATAADVDTVIVDGRTVVREGQHVSIDVAAELRDAIAEVTR